MTCVCVGMRAEPLKRLVELLILSGHHDCREALLDKRIQADAALSRKADGGVMKLRLKSDGQGTSRCDGRHCRYLPKWKTLPSAMMPECGAGEGVIGLSAFELIIERRLPSARPDTASERR